MATAQRFPMRGEIWWTNFHTDPPDKGRRPALERPVPEPQYDDRADPRLARISDVLRAAQNITRPLSSQLSESSSFVPKGSFVKRSQVHLQ